MVETKAGTLERLVPRGAFRLAALAVLAGAAALAAAAPPRDGQDRAPTPLAKELEGLEPGPRIAYLKFLLSSGRVDPEVLFQLGVAFHESGAPDSAAAWYERSIEADPKLSKALVNLGVLWDERGQPPRALDAYLRAVAIDSNDVLARTYAAAALLEMKEYEAAWTHLSRAFAVDSLNPQVRFHLAIFFWESGIYREALREWERVVALAPGGPLAKKAEENIAILQQALTRGGPPPERP